MNCRHELTGAVLAPQNNETLGELRGRRAQEREGPIPHDREGLRDFIRGRGVKNPLLNSF